jgi:hypothetical protein
MLTVAGGMAAALWLGACGYLENRLKSCEDTRVELVNSDQTRAPVYLVGPDETATADTFLESGGRRRVSLCLDKGDRKKFLVYAAPNTDPLAIIHCVASHAAYEGITPRVIWTPIGFQCESW